MSISDYEKAFKLGQKKFREHTSRGNYPYLPVLDDILAQTDIESRTNLGLVDIPLELIVGTSTEGRTTAFASNFMPLLGVTSEFATKWGNLCDALIQEGQRDPIVAYEFMGRFYVVEGNKRVSVSKYIGAVSVTGTVTRMVPKRNDDPENIIYFEYVDFYNITKINYVWFSHQGSYQKLLKHVSGSDQQPWTHEDRIYFRSAWLAFTKEYYALGGEQLSCTAADAMLTYLNLYTFQSLLEDSADEIRDHQQRIWDEFLLIDKDDSVALLLDPNEKAPKKGLFGKLLSPEPEHLRVAFIHHKTAETSSWTYGHELGRAHLEQVFKGQIATCCIDNIEAGEPAHEAIEQAIADGYNVIFTTTPEFINSSLRAAVDHPEIRIVNCSLNTPHRYIRTYYGRMHEAKFLSGVLAGILAENNKIGYIADYPIFGVTANINAFSLGAKMVNPDVKVYLEWFSVKDSDPYEQFQKKDISIISNREMIVPGSKMRAFGLYSNGENTKTNLAMPIWHWGIFYEKIIRSILSGAWNLDDSSDEPQALNYWWGMSAGVIDLIYSGKIAPETQKLLNILKKTICDNKFTPFAGPIYDQDGHLRYKQGEIIAPEDIISMDWLVDNVIGTIPGIDELVDDAKHVVKSSGIATPDKR